MHIHNKLLLHNTEQSIEICNNMNEPQNNYVSGKKMISYHKGKHASNDLGTELERRKGRLLERWAVPYSIYDNSFRCIYTSQNLDFKHMEFTVYQVYVNQD